MIRMTLGIVIAVLLGIATPDVAAEKGSFNSDGVEIHYTIEGEGPPLLLIHGYRASGLLNWRAPGLISRLSEDYRVITPDMRGHGSSETPSDDTYGIAMVKDVVRLLDHLSIDKVYVAGYSMGGMITNKLLTLHPERVRAAAVCGMGWYHSEPGSGNGGSGGDNENAPERYEIMRDQFHELSTTEDEMKAIDVPLTVIVGTDDEGQLPRVDEWRGLAPGLDVKYIQGAKHGDCVFKKDFGETLKAFFDERENK